MSDPRGIREPHTTPSTTVILVASRARSGIQRQPVDQTAFAARANDDRHGTDEVVFENVRGLPGAGTKADYLPSAGGG
jgi:hypothetical protein